MQENGWRYESSPKVTKLTFFFSKKEVPQDGTEVLSNHSIYLEKVMSLLVQSESFTQCTQR